MTPTLDLQARLLDLAEEIALDSYGCDLSSLPLSSLARACRNVTEADLHGRASNLAAWAWEAA
jgi:hypothetical protein